MTRPSRDLYFTMMSQLVATRATCLRRSVGCILTDIEGRVLATGYNGVARGVRHCNEGHPCAAAHAQSGMSLDGCGAIHAEQNAILQCRDPDRIFTCYVTTSPCVTCVKLLMNTGCRRIIFAERYAHDEASKRLWTLSRQEHTARKDQPVWYHLDVPADAWLELSPFLKGEPGVKLG